MACGLWLDQDPKLEATALRMKPRHTAPHYPPIRDLWRPHGPHLTVLSSRLSCGFFQNILPPFPTRNCLLRLSSESTSGKALSIPRQLRTLFSLLLEPQNLVCSVPVWRQHLLPGLRHHPGSSRHGPGPPQPQHHTVLRAHFSRELPCPCIREYPTPTSPTPTPPQLYIPITTGRGLVHSCVSAWHIVGPQKILGGGGGVHSQQNRP